MPSAVECDAASESAPALTAAAALALLRASEADMNAGRVEAARDGFEAVVASGLCVEWAHFFLGRIHREQSQDDDAMRAFASAIESDRNLFWAHYERLTLAVECGSAEDRLASFATEMAAVRWEALQPPHVRIIETIAHRLWDTGYPELGGTLLALLWPANELGKLALIRIVGAKVEEKSAKGAAKRLETFTELDQTDLKVLADHHQAHGDLDGEIAILEKRRAAAPKDFQTWLGLVRALARKGNPAKTNAAMTAGMDFPMRQRSFVSLIAHLELGDIEAAFFDLRNHARLYGEIPKFPGIRLAYLLGDIFDVPRRNEVLGLILSAYEGDKDVALVQINAAMRDQRWDDARAMFATHFADVENKSQNVRLTNIDILAFSGKLEEAAALLEAERVEGICPPAFLRSTLRILSELDRWNEVFAIGLANLGDDISFEHFLSVMVRASRKANRSADLFDGLMALPQPLVPAQADTLLAVMEDMAELGHADIIDRIGDVPIPYEREHRIRLKLRAADGLKAPTIRKDLCIYYCADKNYLIPALVSLTALAMSNVSIMRRAVFHIVVDHETVPFAQEAGGAIAKRLGLSLVVTDASTIVTSADRLRTSYGIFTGGQQLALAAYYRIFFARWLVDQHQYAQALYVDADTVVRSGLDELFAADRKAPLMARYETDRPEVRHATQVHALKGRYFNSGVLRFDLTHPELPGLLDAAIAAAIDPGVNLIFQDQCALNIAFDLKMSELPERFNYFNPPSVSGDGIAATDAVIVHFLDRPKPWDSLYRKRAREWFEWYDLVETLRLDMAHDRR